MDREEERYWDPRRSISHERKEELTERGHLMNSGAHWDENPSQMYSSRVSDCTRYRPMQESVSSVHGVYTHGNGGKYHQEGRGMYNQDPSQRVYAEKGHVCDAYEAMDPRRKQLTPHYTAGDRKRPITISREEEEIRFLRRAHFAPPSSTALYHRRTNVLDTESLLNHSTGSGYVDCRAPTPPPFLSQHGSTKRLIPTHSQQKMSAIPTKNISISPENTAVGQEVTSSPRTATSNTNTNKRSRYLRDTDRMSIIQRIENGEKQADLAREFGVTRAAICHINKNREEILTRYDRLVKSAYEMCVLFVPTA
jgi:DNA-binding XRE family transcriptional regulator